MIRRGYTRADSKSLKAVTGQVADLAPGIFKYVPRGHALVRAGSGDKRFELSDAAFAQRSVAEAPIVLAFAAVFSRTTAKYGGRGSRYVYMEAGHAAQNVYLQAVSLKLGTVVIGAFDDERVTKILGLPSREQPLYLMPVGSM